MHARWRMMMDFVIPHGVPIQTSCKYQSVMPSQYRRLRFQTPLRLAPRAAVKYVVNNYVEKSVLTSMSIEWTHHLPHLRLRRACPRMAVCRRDMSCSSLRLGSTCAKQSLVREQHTADIDPTHTAEYGDQGQQQQQLVILRAKR